MLVPTPRFWLLVGLGVPIAGLAAAVGSPMLAVAYDVLLVVAAWATWRFGPSGDGLRVERRFDPVLSVRAANRIALSVVNETPEPITMQLRDEPPPAFEASQKEFRLHIEPEEEARIEYTITPRERGDESFRGTWVRLACPLGLAMRQVKLETEEPVRVYPNVLALREFEFLKQQGRLREMGIRRSRVRGLGTEFESLRHYGEGDDYRKIDWKASARRGDLVVRQYEQERNQVVMLCIDIGRHMLSEVDGVRKLDHVLDALLMLTHATGAAGDYVGVMVYADTVRRYLPPQKGRNQVGAIIEAIHDLIAEPVESDPSAAFAYLARRWKRRSLLIHFTDYDEPDRAGEIVASFGPISRRHLSLLCRVRDPKLDEIALEPTETRDDMYRKTAATTFLEERREGDKLVLAAGINQLDAEPQDLAARLVNYYFAVKERNLL